VSAQTRSVAFARVRTLKGLVFALGVVLGATPVMAACDAAITAAEALAPLAMLLGTRAVLNALTAHRSPWPGLLLLAAGEAVPAFGSRVVNGPVLAAVSRATERALRPRVQAALATMPWARLEDPAARDRLDRVEDGIVAVDVAWDSAGALLRDIGRGCSALAFLWTVSPWAALGAAAALVPDVLLRRAAAEQFESVRLAAIPARRVAGYLFGLLTGRGAAAEARLFGFAAYVRGRWRDAVRRVQTAEAAQQVRTALLGLAASALQVALMASAAGLVLLGRHGAGATAAGILALTSVFRQTGDLSYWVASLVRDGGDAANLAEVLSWGRALRPWPLAARLTRRHIVAARRCAEAPRPGPVAALRGVTFTYPGAPGPAVADLTLDVRAGERLALVGPNGSGKSTAVKLLLGLLTPDAGDALPPIRAGVALQEFGRYSLTAGENVGLGRPAQMHASGRIAAATARVGLDLPPEQPLGRLRRGGIEPSGGRWQRLALARAWRSQAPLLVLDEPTAALDPLAEARLYADFSRLVAGRSVVLVTHRLAAARLADRIAVFAAGRIVQAGTHAALLAEAEGPYARMWAAQSGWAR